MINRTYLSLGEKFVLGFGVPLSLGWVRLGFMMVSVEVLLLLYEVNPTVPGTFNYSCDIQFVYIFYLFEFLFYQFEIVQYNFISSYNIVKQ